MLRILMAGLAMLAASGCTFGLPSAVDAAPFEARPAEAPFADGEYCSIAADEAGELMVQRPDDDDEDACATFVWDASQRLFVMRDNLGKEGEFKLVALGDGFFMVQFPTTPDDDSPFAFMLMAAVAQGEAAAILPLPNDETYVPLAARYPGIALSTYKPSLPPFMTPVAPEGAEPLPPEPDHFYISAGSPAEIHDFVRDILREGIRKGSASRASDSRVWKGEGLIVRDQPTPADHAPSLVQLRDIDALVAKLQALAPSP